ncbi:MAG: hypothetical protein R8G33_03985 [Gammaproteobacteria bacterium]|nr:hypothetical protein [Gammaproteobacteria bacterium]
MNVDKVLYHLKEADKELNQITNASMSSDTYSHQSYLIAMSDVYDFVLSIKESNDNNSAIRDDY